MSRHFFLPLFLFNICTQWQCFSSPSIYNSEDWVNFTPNYDASDQRPPPPVSGSWRDSNTKIFIGISEFRDNRCAVTLQNIFSKAKNPYRIHVGLVQQIHTEEDHIDCIAAYCKQAGHGCPHKEQIKTITLSYLDARGPGFARTMQADSLQDEDFCMQIDSHSDVIKDWDSALTAMWGSIDNEYAVLSTTPPDISSLGKNVNNRWEVPHLCQATFTESGMVRNLLPRAAMDLEKPILAPLWSAGFSFSKCHAEKKTPPDPNFLFIFDGEEFTKFARLWTRGYDVYTPNRIVVAHDYAGKLNVL